MEKLIYPMWTDDEGSALRERLLETLVQPLLGLPGVRGVRLCVADDAVAPAAEKRLARQAPLPGAVLSLWLDDAGARQAHEALVDDACQRWACLLVTEAEPIVNRSQAPDTAGRLPGFCQVVFLQTPPRLSREEWLDIWQGSHTRVAIDTQSTFAYRQNVVVRTLAAPEQRIDAVVEENFPEAAMTSDLAFYDAADDAELQARFKAMMESCARFIDFERMDVIPMSEYVFGELLSRPAP